MSSEAPPRIASLVPSLTELVATLGLGDWLVARTGWCIHPAETVARVPKIGGTKTVNLRKLERLRPTHVLVNVDENRRDTVDAIGAWAEPPRLIVTHPLGPEDNLALIETVAEPFLAQTGVAEAAAALRIALGEALDAVVADGRRPKRVLYLIWHAPWMTVARDTYCSRMLARIGWHTWPDHDGGPAGAGRYPTLDGSEAWLADVECVLLSSEPFAFAESHAREAQALCPNARVLRVDGELLSWYGSRAVEGLGYLRRLAADDNDAPWTRSSR